MTLSCTIDDSKAFANAVGLAARRVMASPQQPILGGLLLEMDDAGPGVLRATGFDGDSSSAVTIDVGPMSVPEAGRVVVSGSKLAQLAKTLPAKPITLQELPTMLRMTCGGVAIELPLMPVEDYPTLPGAAEPAGTVDAVELRSAIERVIGACDVKGETSKPALTGVHFALATDSIALTATNGYRVAVASAPWNGNGLEAGTAVLVPGRIVADVASALSGLGQVRIGITHTVISFDGLGVTTVTRLLDGKQFPGRPKPMWLTQGETPTEVYTTEMLEALKRADLGNDPKVRHARLAFDGDTVRVSSTGAVIDTNVACKHHGPPTVLTVNSGYLADALTACDSAVALLTLRDGSREPVLVTAPDVEGFAHLIMPIRKG